MTRLGWAAGSLLLTTGAHSTEHTMFTQNHFENLRFLEGHWQGTAPGGSTFFDGYAFSGPTELRATHYADDSFGTPGDGSTVRLEAGEVVSRWGQFSWRATEISSDRACFEPINASGHFSWQRVSAQEVQVSQRWTDAEGTEQQYVFSLQRR